MNDINKIREFLSHNTGLRLVRGSDIYSILHVFEDGEVATIRNPHMENDYCHIHLTDAESACLANLCFAVQHEDE